jgi:hypothetical protein
MANFETYKLKEKIDGYDKTNKQKVMLMIDGQALSKILDS